jgi:SPP1 gp7 family putative phage head morphogenesis protein
MANVGYVNKKVQAMYGIPYNQLTDEQKAILHADSKRRAKLIKEREEAVLKNNLKAFQDEAKMEKVLASIYKNTQKQILADVAETIAKVKKAGGTWSYANQSALTRSRGLFEQITAELNKLGQQEQEVFTQGLSNIYTDQFLRQVYELGQTIPVKANFNRLNPALVKKTLDYPWSGAMFSDRIWLDKETLGKNLRVGLTQSMILGEGIPEITDRINKGIDTSRYNAERLARTETKRVTYVAHNDAYEDMGVDKLRYRVANGGDHRVCKVCMGDNNKEYKRGEEPTLPRHPNCRCVYIPVVSDEFGENELNELTNSVRGAENYEKWRKNQEKSLKKSDDYDNDTIESLMKDLDKVEAQKKIFENKRNSAGAVIRGLDEPQDRGFKDIAEAQKAKQEAEDKLKDLEETQNKLYIKIEKKRKELLTPSNQPIPLTYTTQKGFNFSDGTGNIKTKKVKDAVIATTMDGISIVTPAKVDSKKQLLTSQKISDLLDTLPLEIRQHCKEIQLVDYYNPKDSYWAKTYNMKGFYSYATGGNGKITFYRNDKSRGNTDTVNNSDNWIREVLCHELGHSIDQLSASILSKSTTKFGSDGADYLNAITEDFKVCKEMWASDYGQSSNSVHEDFADSVAEFVINPLAFKKKFPNRYKYIEEVLNSL